MRVGDSLEVLYALTRPLVAGNYDIAVNGYTPAADAMLHAELRVRRAGEDTVIGSVESTPQTPSFKKLQHWIAGTVMLPYALDGDALVLHVQYVSGSADFSVLETHASMP